MLEIYTTVWSMIAQFFLYLKVWHSHYRKTDRCRGRKLCCVPTWHERRYKLFLPCSMDIRDSFEHGMLEMRQRLTTATTSKNTGQIEGYGIELAKFHHTIKIWPTLDPRMPVHAGQRQTSHTAKILLCKPKHTPAHVTPLFYRVGVKYTW
jgi:hypothetical protein